MIKKILSVVLTVPLIVSNTDKPNSDFHENYPDGWVMWHSYSDYSAKDSRLFVCSPNGTTTEITGNFIHAMNGDFGSSPAEITFMAIDKYADEWDIFLYNSITHNIKNLTQNSGFRNEDPKFSPDGNKIVFKRGYWNSEINDFSYNIAEYDFKTNKTEYLTEGNNEKAMPCYSSDGRYIYYTEYSDGFSVIKKLDTLNSETELIFTEDKVTAYYPITAEGKVYFTKWHSADNHNDMIMCFDGEKTEPLPFNSSEYNCSDACPVNDTSLIYSCTKNGNYDLFFYDNAEFFPLDEFNTEKNELGASFFPLNDYYEYLKNMDSFLLTANFSDSHFDLNDDGITDCFDMILARKMMNPLLTNPQR